jgi:hypothetical protein
MTTLSNRRTIVAHGRLAMRELRLDAARPRRHGVQIISFEQLAVRLAGGFARPIDDECLRTAIQAVLPDTTLGELESIKLLPGMVNAAAYDDLAFALPANAGATYYKRKLPAATEAFGDAALVWEAQ